MLQARKFTKEEILDLSSENYRDIDCDSTTWLSSTLNSPKVKTRVCDHHKVAVSAEELKIRSELEMEIEKDLEQETKESIYHLALRLHRIYKQRKDRNSNNNARSEAAASPEYGGDDKRTSSRTLSEVNISIRMEGGVGTRVEIKEVNKQVAERGYCATRSSNNNFYNASFGAKNKFDWVKTLRKGSCSSPVAAENRLNKCTSKHRITEPNNNAVVSNSKFDCGRGKNSGSSSNWSANNKKKRVQLVWKV